MSQMGIRHIMRSGIDKISNLVSVAQEMRPCESACDPRVVTIEPDSVIAWDNVDGGSGHVDPVTYRELLVPKNRSDL